MRIRITFSKTEAMRYTGHLDLHRAWERTLRRAALPLAYSQGFHPQPRLNLASALPLGFTSQCELVDIWLEEPQPLSAIENTIREALPPGMRLHQIKEVESSAPALQRQLQAAEFTAQFLHPVPDLDARIKQLLSAKNLPRERRGKSYDLRPLIQRLERLPDDGSGWPRLFMCLQAQEGATGRPEEIIAALGLSATEVRVQRTALLFQDDHDA